MNGAVKTDMAKVRQRKRAMVDREVAFHLDAYKRSGAELIMGTGRFVAPRTIEVQLNDGGTRLLAGDQIVLNIGTHAAIPDIPGLAAAGPLTHIEALELDYAPAHLVVLGGGSVAAQEIDTYLAGYQVISANYKRGALVILQHLWETQRGPGTAASGVIGSEEHWRQPGEFFSVPAKEWMGPPSPMLA